MNPLVANPELARRWAVVDLMIGGGWEVLWRNVLTAVALEAAIRLGQQDFNGERREPEYEAWFGGLT